MNKLIKQGPLLFAIAILSYGAENLACAHYGITVRGVPWFPVNPFLGYLTGIALIAASLSIVFNVRARLTAILLGILFLLYVLFLEAALVVAKPMNIGIRTVFFEALSMGGAALTLAAILPAGAASRQWDSVLDKLIWSGPYLFAVSLIVFGVDHFLILDFIASLVPAWIPWHLFWAYFTGAAFIAAGIAILIGRMDRLGATWLGIMFMLWFLLLHSPRVVNAFRSHNPNVQNEWSSAFIALGMCGGCWIVACHAQRSCLRSHRQD